jgi:hypothetical protein
MSKPRGHNRPNTPNRRAVKGIGTEGKRWRSTRSAYLNDHPFCEHPDGCREPATSVHHLDGLGPTGPHGNDWSNLQALCNHHHGVVENEKRNRGADGQWA